MSAFSRHRFLRSTAIIFIASFVVIGTFLWATAGSLEPTVSPAGTFYSVSDIYDAIASSTYDSSSISADANGSVFEVTKCIIARMTGGSCP